MPLSFSSTWGEFLVYIWESGLWLLSILLLQSQSSWFNSFHEEGIPVSFSPSTCSGTRLSATSPAEVVFPAVISRLCGDPRPQITG